MHPLETDVGLLRRCWSHSARRGSLRPPLPQLMLVGQHVIRIHIIHLTLSGEFDAQINGVLVFRCSGTGRIRVQRHWAGVTEVALARRRDARQLLRLQQRCSWDTPIGCNILHGRCTGRNADCRDRCVNDLASIRVGQTHRGRSSGHDGRY